MPFFEAIRLALQTIWVQKLKSFFTLLGVMIGVTFLIAVVSIVGGMSRYMTDQVVGKIMAVNSFELGTGRTSTSATTTTNTGVKCSVGRASARRMSSQSSRRCRKV